ncbi:MAG: aldo/keto reductase [Candidatus Omnitrophica bacterium]|nr:aldo/keto reductase [Candidatus Omnitrophota bacterium]
MKYVNFPGTQEKVSVVGLGTWVFGGENWGGADDALCIKVVEEALALGMNFIDTAPFYTDGLSERLIGQALRGKREKAFIATKCGLVRKVKIPMVDLSPSSIMKEVDLSLERLQCDMIDLYQCHWPDKATPVEKTMETLMKLQDLKKIRYIGVSNFDLTLLKRAVLVAPVKTLQMSYSLLDRSIEKELLPFCREKGIGIISYGPMGGGILTGKYKEPPKFGKFDARSMFYKYYSGDKFSVVKNAVEALREMGHPLNQLALNWVRQQPGVITALAGSRTPEQVQSNAASADWDLSPSEMEQISKIKF